MPTPLTATALALLPQREAYYTVCCQHLTDALAAADAARAYVAQQMVCYALAALNRTREAAGLSALAGPRLHSLDELLALEPEASTALAA